MHNNGISTLVSYTYTLQVLSFLTLYSRANCIKKKYNYKDYRLQIVIIGRYICQLSQIIEEFSGYGNDLPLALPTGLQISRIRSLVMGSRSDKIDFLAFLCFCLKFSTFLLSKLEVFIFIVDIVRSWGHLSILSLVTGDLKIEVWSFYRKRQTEVWG